jgi:hypothetical protein
MYRICQISKLQITKSHIGAGDPVFKVSARYVINVGFRKPAEIQAQA